MTDSSDEDTLAYGMIDVHGTEAAAVARGNARAAALACPAMQVKSWMRVLGIIQRRQAGQVSSIRISRAGNKPKTSRMKNKTSILKSNQRCSYHTGRFHTAWTQSGHRSPPFPRPANGISPPLDGEAEEGYRGSPVPR